jgi:hypothetical protein
MSEDVRIDVHGDRKRQAHNHAGGVSLERLGHEIAQFREFHNLRKNGVHAPAADAQECRVETYVFHAAQIGMETRSKLQERSHAPVYVDGSPVGRDQPGNQAQQRALPGAVGSDQGEALARLHAKKQAFKRVERLRAVTQRKEVPQVRA